MSRAQKTVQRVVEDLIPIERCDGCGAEVETDNEDGFYKGPPPTWFVVFAPEDRTQYRAGLQSSHSFCSAKCLEIFAFAEVGKASS